MGRLHVLVHEDEEGIRVQRVTRCIARGRWDATQELPLSDELRARRFPSMALLRDAIRVEVSGRSTVNQARGLETAASSARS